MIKTDDSMNTYKENLSKAFDTNLPEADKTELLTYFLNFKSQTINHVNGCPPKAQEAVNLLQTSLNKANKSSDKQSHWYQKPIGIIFLSVVGITLAWLLRHLLTPYIQI